MSNEPRDENDSLDQTGFGAKPPKGAIIAFFSMLGLCCGLLLQISGVSLAAIFPSWPLIGGALALLGVVGFLWHLRRRRRATCPGAPKRSRTHPSPNSAVGGKHAGRS